MAGREQKKKKPELEAGAGWIPGKGKRVYAGYSQSDIGRVRVELQKLLAAPRGQFYEKLRVFCQTKQVPREFFDRTLNKRLREVGGNSLLAEWKNLEGKRRVFEKVLMGQNPAKFGATSGKSTVDVKRGLDEIERQIAKIIARV